MEKAVPVHFCFTPGGMRERGKHAGQMEREMKDEEMGKSDPEGKP